MPHKRRKFLSFVDWLLKINKLGINQSSHFDAVLLIGFDTLQIKRFRYVNIINYIDVLNFMIFELLFKKVTFVALTNIDELVSNGEWPFKNPYSHLYR